MTKPKKKVIEELDYFECQKYIEEKYNIKLDDYNNRSGHENRFITETNNPRPAYYHVANQHGHKYAYPINSTDTWKFYVEDKEVTEPVYEEAKKKFKTWQVAYDTWLLTNPKPPRQEFWNDFLLNSYDLHNGSSFEMYESTIEEVQEEWIKHILTLFIQEFGEGEEGARIINFEVSW